MRTTITALLSVLFLVSVAWAQTTPTQEEITRWKKDAQALEDAPCKMVTWLFENARKDDREHIRQTLGWWGRGFVEGAAYTLDLHAGGNEGKAMKKMVVDFGLTVDVVTAHLTAYCYANPTHTPGDGVQDLLLKAMK